MYFIGYSIACLLLPRFCDLYGRKKVYFISITIQIFLMTGATVNKSLPGQHALIFFMGIVGVGRSTIGFLYLVELVPPKNKKLIGTLTNASDALIYIFSSFYLWVLSRNVVYLLVIGICLNVIVAICVFFIPESPDFLHDIRDYDGVRRVF
jgi:MFS family permease